MDKMKVYLNVVSIIFALLGIYLIFDTIEDSKIIKENKKLKKEVEDLKSYIKEDMEEF